MAADADAGGFDGLIDDELLLHVFANYLTLPDLLRCAAATCHRWRRLVAANADFLFRSHRRHVTRGDDPALEIRAVGFFHQTSWSNNSYYEYAAASSSSSEGGRFLLPPPSTWRDFLGTDDNAGGGDLIKNSRLLASRRGRLLLELPDGGAGHLRLAVVNLTTGAVFNLPSLAGNDKPYACAFVTAADLQQHPPPSAAGFRVLLLYKRGGGGAINDDEQSSMACRSCSSSSETTSSAWGPEITVTGGANVSMRRMGEMAEAAAGVAVDGAVFWLAGKLVFGLHDDATAKEVVAVVEAPKWYAMTMHRFVSGGSPSPDHRRLTVLPPLPDGRRRRRLGAVQIGRDDDGRLVVNVFSRNDGGGKRRPRWVWEHALDVDLDPLLPPPKFAGGATGRRVIRLRAVCEENGLVYFATMDDGKEVVSYALDLEKKKVEEEAMVPHAGRCCFCWNKKPPCRLVAFMATTPVAYLASLGACVLEDQDSSSLNGQEPESSGGTRRPRKRQASVRLSRSEGVK